MNMKQANGKTQMLVVGLLIGMAMAGLMVALIAGGYLRGVAFLAVILLISLSALAGWILGTQRRLCWERHRIWLAGYKEGREKGAW